MGREWGQFRRSFRPQVGLGESRSLDTVTAAVTGDGHLAVACLPLQRAVTINPARLVRATPDHRLVRASCGLHGHC